MENGDDNGESSYSNADTTEIPKNNTTMESEALAKGLSSTLTTIIKDFDSKAQQTFASQHQLSETLDRLTRELDKLLEDAPMPFIMQHAAKITAVRKRVLSLNSVLKNVQRRLDNIDRILTVGVPHQNQHVSGAVCASSLARNGLSVTLFESARGPGGRMSQRRENVEDGKELLFDHGAPFFNANNTEVMSLVHEWESKGLAAIWKEKFGSFDHTSNKFVDLEQDGLISKRYVGIPGMNSICKTLCREPGVESKFGTSVGRLEWLEDQNLWSLIGLDGQNLGQFKGVVATDKNIVSPRFTSVTGKPPPLDLTLFPELAVKLNDIPIRPCFALMIAFAKPLTSIPFKGFSIKNSEVLSWAHCDSSKPGRSTSSERWVLHFTMEYAQRIIAQTGLQKLSDATLTKVAEELFQELQSLGLDISHPFFKKAHRWGSAFPATSIAKEEKCLWDGNKRLSICGDFCVSPDVEGAIVSGLAAASKLSELFSCLG